MNALLESGGLESKGLSCSRGGETPRPLLLLKRGSDAVLPPDIALNLVSASSSGIFPV